MHAFRYFRQSACEHRLIGFGLEGFRPADLSEGAMRKNNPELRDAKQNKDAKNSSEKNEKREKKEESTEKRVSDVVKKTEEALQKQKSRMDNVGNENEKLQKKAEANNRNVDDVVTLSLATMPGGVLLPEAKTPTTNRANAKAEAQVAVSSAKPTTEVADKGKVDATQQVAASKERPADAAGKLARMREGGA